MGAPLLTVTMGQLIEDALRQLYRLADRPKVVTIGTTGLNLTTDTQFTLASASDWNSVNVSDSVENGQELMLVIGKSTDATPIYTVVRGYANTPLATAPGAPTGTQCILNPSWGRYEIYKNVIKCLHGPMAHKLPKLIQYETTPTLNRFYLDLPADCMRVENLSYRIVYTGGGVFPFQSQTEITGWRYEEDLPIDVTGVAGFLTGKIVTIPKELAIISVNAPTSQVQIYVVYQQNYQWTNGGDFPTNEQDTLTMYVGSEDLPSLYAAAYCVTGREYSRLQIDRTEQWQQEQSIRAGVNLKMVQLLWSEFHDRLDEARQVKQYRKHRTYRQMKRRI